MIHKPRGCPLLVLPAAGLDARTPCLWSQGEGDPGELRNTVHDPEAQPPRARESLLGIPTHWRLRRRRSPLQRTSSVRSCGTLSPGPSPTAADSRAYQKPVLSWPPPRRLPDLRMRWAQADVSGVSI